MLVPSVVVHPMNGPSNRRPDVGTLFPMLLADLVPADHMCRVVDAFVEEFAMESLDYFLLPIPPSQ